MNREPLHAEGQLSHYTAAEILQIQAVLNSLFFGKNPEKNHKPKLILTGGYPGAGKSAFAHQFASTNREFIRIDVDDNCLFTIPGYQKDYLEQEPEVAYTKWRPAANWIAQNAVKKALDKNYNLILVGTATSPQIPDLIAAAKEKKYSTELHGFAAPLDICLKRSKPENRFSYLDHTGDISVMIPQDHITEKRTRHTNFACACITFGNKNLDYKKEGKPLGFSCRKLHNSLFCI
ncbi:MAG: zeta toxin family protein [Pseudobdellovibrionaceae bacterium]|jgi:predicted kinase|nr:zeta toxin family protein [Pseudobdellovibrionaceae bacterium]